MTQSFVAAAAQFAPVFLDRDATVAKACDVIRRAGEAGARLVVFPEVYVAGYPDWTWVVPCHNGLLLNDLYARLVENAVAIPDDSTARLADAARRAKTHVVIGVNERNTEASGASLFNTLLFIDERGEIMGKHRKLIPTGAERLVWAQGDGSTLSVFASSIGRIGGLICWENYMPLARQAVYDGGAQVLVTPTWDKSENWLTSLGHIAREGGLFVISCCTALRLDDIPDEYGFKSQYPAGREWINPGNSCVIGPTGRTIAGPVAGKEELILAEIDLGDIRAAKRIFDVAGHYARPDVFEFTVRRRAEGTQESPGRSTVS